MELKSEKPESKADPLKAEVDRIIAKGNPWQAVALLWGEIERLRGLLEERKGQ